MTTCNGSSSRRALDPAATTVRGRQIKSGPRSLPCTDLQDCRRSLHEVGIELLVAPPNVRHEFHEPPDPGVDRHVSALALPLKGFRCAHAALFGGESCSAAVRRLVSEQGLLGGRGEIAARFQTCRQAYGHLAAARTSGEACRACAAAVLCPFRSAAASRS
ncbi:membrane protein insertion efficiency factor YidD [Deinococcus caeni]|uniref:membrane protein insertion efficiency factor YidD n=1 Tax=Deinococcus caeni TaxID=569127 RepID=UPI003614A738